MKKAYQKPMVVVENYQLTQSIASCGNIVSLYDSGCILTSGLPSQWKDFATLGYFMEGYCDYFFVGMDKFDGVCYHTNAGNPFNS